MTSIQIQFKFNSIQIQTSQKERFDAKIREMRAGQAKNVTMFYDTEYDDFVAKKHEFKNQSYKMTPYDFSLLKRFEILRVEKDGETFAGVLDQWYSRNHFQPTLENS